MSSSKGKEMKTMENFNYNLIIKNNGNEIVIKTNDVAYAIKEYLRADEAGCEVCLCNGYTGEVLCHNGDEPYCTDEMALMILGYMCAEAWGEEDEDEDDEPAEETGGEMVLRLITGMGGLPSYLNTPTKCGGGFSFHFLAARSRAREPKFYYNIDPSNLSIGKPHK